MANTLKLEIIVDDKGTPIVQKFADGTTSAVGKVEKAGEAMGGGFAKSWQGMVTGGNQAIQLFREIASVIEAPIQAYMESEKALLKMGMAMKNQGDFSKEALADLQDFAEQIQKTTAYEDDFTLAVMGNLKSYGMTNEEVKKATKAALDFATAKANEGMTVEKASEVIGRAYLGETGNLKRLGIQIDENAKGSEVFAAVMDQLNSRFGGSAQAELLTYSGQWKQLRNQWGDIQEFLGIAFLKTIEALGFTMSMFGAGFWKVVEGIMQSMDWLFGGLEKFASFVGLEKVSQGIGAVKDVFADAAQNANEASAAATKNASVMYDNLVAFNKVTGAIENMGIAGKRTVAIDKEAAEAAKKAAQEREQALKAMTEDIRKANVEIEGIGQTQFVKDMARIESEAAEYLKKSKDRVAVAQWRAAEEALAVAKQTEEIKKAVDKNADELAKSMLTYYETQDKERKEQDAAWKKSEDEKIALKETALAKYKDLMTDEADFAATENERAINKIIAQEGEKLNKLYQIYADGGISYKEMQAAEVKINKNAKAAILERETETALKIADIEGDIFSKKKGFQDKTYEYTIKKLEATVAKYEAMGVSAEAVALLIKNTFEEAEDAKTLASNDFFAGYKLGLKEIEEAEKTIAQIGKDLAKDVHDFRQGLVKAGVEAFIKGEDAMLAIKQYAGEQIVQLAGKYANMAFDAAIEKTIGIIGAYIGEGAAGSGAKAASGGVWAAIGEIGLYLAGGVAAMLGGRALAQQFRAEGGWIGAHPDGGIIKQGSGVRDDVYLGRTENTRHWGMGGEFVVNKAMTAKYADLLVAINSGNINKVTDTGFAAGGWTGHKGQPLVGDPVDLALRMAGGGQLCFAKAFGEALGSGSDIYGAIGSGIGATATYIGTAMGGALSGKLLGNSFKEKGGPIQDMGHFNLPRFITSVFLPGLPNPFGGGVSVGPGIYFEPDPTKVWQDTLDWIERMWKEFLESQQAGWRNFAEVILTPGDMSMDALSGLEHELGHFGQHLLNVSYNILRPPGVRFAGESGVSALNGLDYVPRDNFKINAHRGEAVLTKRQADDWRGGKGAGISYTFNLYATVADKKAVNELAGMIYPQLQKIERRQIGKAA